MKAIDSVLVNSDLSGNLAPGIAAAPDSLTVRNISAGKVFLLTKWDAGPGTTLVTHTSEIKSPALHDNRRAIHTQCPAQGGAVYSGPEPLIDAYSPQLLRKQDTLEVDIVDDTISRSQVLLLNYYQDLPGSNAELIGSDRLSIAGGDIVGVKVIHTPTGTHLWEDAQSLVSVYDVLEADTKYALLGAQVVDPAGNSQHVTAVALSGSDTGKLRVAVPGNVVNPSMTSWFYRNLSDVVRTPLIPVFNAANKQAIFSEIASGDLAIATTIEVVWMFQKLNF